MKKISLTIIACLIFLSPKSWAQSYSNQGIINDLTTINPQDFLAAIEPKINTRLIAETQFDDDDKDYDLSGKIRLYNNLKLSKQIWLSSLAIAERIDNSGTNNTNKNRYFDNNGAYLQEFALHTSTEKYSLVAGKFNLNFGNAWRFERGIWAGNLAKNYRQTEKLGFSGVYRVGDIQKTGQYNFTFSTFTNDRKNFDNSILVNRDSTHKSDAAPGDKRSLSSYQAGLNINFDFGKNDKLSYNFSYLNLAVDKKLSAVPASKIDDQKASVFGINYHFPLRENLEFDFLLEYTGIRNVGGNSDKKEKYLTANLITKIYKNWIIFVGNSKYRDSTYTKGREDQRLNEISFGYEFNKTKFFDRLTIDVGYKRMQTNDYTNNNYQNSLGILLRYYKYF
jgi:hypothetical protein